MWTLSKENEAKIPEWNKRWIEDVILRTKSMTPLDKLEVETAIRAMYRLAKLDGDNVNVVFVRSPLAAKAVAGAAVDYWCKKDKTVKYNTAYNAMIKATLNTILSLVALYTYSATFHTTYKATVVAILNAIIVAFDISISNAMYSAAIYRDAIYRDVTHRIVTHRMADEGNFNSHECSCLSFIRDVIGFECKEYKNYKHYETFVKQSSTRYVYPNFCVISDFPTELHHFTRNGELVAHNDKGPSHLWSDGFAIWTINGVEVTEQIVMSPETLTIKQIDAVWNEDVKRIMIERFTWARYITETNAECIDARINDVDGTSEALMVLKDKSVRLLCACKSTARVYAIRVNSRIKKCQEAQSWMSGDKKINVIGVS